MGQMLFFLVKTCFNQCPLALWRWEWRFVVNGQPFYVKSVTEYPNKPAPNKFLPHTSLVTRIIHFKCFYDDIDGPSWETTRRTSTSKILEQIQSRVNSLDVVHRFISSTIKTLENQWDSREVSLHTVNNDTAVSSHCLTWGPRKWASSTKGMFEQLVGSWRTPVEHDSGT
jgi:hypothetical protein